MKTRNYTPEMKERAVRMLGCVDNYRKWIIVAAK